MIGLVVSSSWHGDVILHQAVKSRSDTLWSLVWQRDSLPSARRFASGTNSRRSSVLTILSPEFVRQSRVSVGPSYYDQYHVLRLWSMLERRCPAMVKAWSFAFDDAPISFSKQMVTP
jgi:hypothetical protein